MNIILKVPFETQSYLRRNINLSMDPTVQPQLQSKVSLFSTIWLWFLVLQSQLRRRKSVPVLFPNTSRGIPCPGIHLLAWGNREEPSPLPSFLCVWDCAKGLLPSFDDTFRKTEWTPYNCLPCNIRFHRQQMDYSLTIWMEMGEREKWKRSSRLKMVGNFSKHGAN